MNDAVKDSQQSIFKICYSFQLLLAQGKTKEEALDSIKDLLIEEGLDNQSGIMTFLKEIDENTDLTESQICHKVKTLQKSYREANERVGLELAKTFLNKFDSAFAASYTDWLESGIEVPIV